MGQSNYEPKDHTIIDETDTSATLRQKKRQSLICSCGSGSRVGHVSRNDDLERKTNTRACNVCSMFCQCATPNAWTRGVRARDRLPEPNMDDSSDEDDWCPKTQVGLQDWAAAALTAIEVVDSPGFI